MGGEVKSNKHEVGVKPNKSGLKITMPAIENGEEKRILGYENYIEGPLLLMQITRNFLFIAPKVLLSPRKLTRFLALQSPGGVKCLKFYRFFLFSSNRSTGFSTE